MTIKRRFIPGEEWIFFKIYSGPKTLEKFLLNEIYQIVRDLYSEEMITHFFFIRYKDEDGHHLRVRFKVCRIESIGNIVNRICTVFSEYCENRIVSKIALDTYNRELERYGSGCIEAVETLFSRSSMQLLNLFIECEDYDTRWLEGIAILDDLLNKFGLNSKDKYEIFEHYYQHLNEEFGSNKIILKELKKRYRVYKLQIEAVLSNSNRIHLINLKYDRENLEDVINNIKEYYSDRKELYFDFFKSISHMHFNRLFISQHRKHEFVLYYMLSNYYKSHLIRGRMSSINFGL